jgi:hypothetical protein
MEHWKLALAVAAVVLAGFLVQQGVLKPDNRVNAIDVNNTTQRVKDVPEDNRKVMIEDGEFNPVEMTIEKKRDRLAQVVWVNRDGQTHLLTLTRNGSAVFSRTVPAGGNFTWPIFEKGTYSFSAGGIEDTGKIVLQ